MQSKHNVVVHTSALEMTQLSAIITFDNHVISKADVLIAYNCNLLVML